MKKYVPFLILPVAAALAAGVLAPKLASEERLRGEIVALVEAKAGRTPVIEGPVSFAVLPWPSIEVERVAIDEPRGRVEIGAARVVLDLLPLLAGTLSADHIELTGADVTLNEPGDGLDAVSALVTGLGAAGSEAEIYVRSGSVRVARQGGDETVIPQADVRIAWRGGRDATVAGRAVWRGEPLDVDLNVSGLAALAAGGAGGLRLSLSGVPADLAFEGGMRLAGGPVVNGALSVSSRKLREALEWLDVEPPTEQGFGPFRLRGAALVSAQGVVLNDARIDLDGNSGVGGFNLRVDGSRAILQGSLASEQLDLSPYGQLALAGVQGGMWSRDAIDLDRTRSMDVDLRLSATQVLAGDASFRGMAASATVKGGKLSLAIGEAEAWGGVFRAALHVAPLDTGAEVRVDLSADDVALAQALGELFRVQRLEGTGSFRLSAGGAGASVMEIVQNLGGAFTLTGEKGALVGIDVGRILARLEKRPLSGGGDLRGGRTPYDSIVVDASISGGIAKLDRIDLQSSKLRIALAGESSIAQRDLDFAGTAQLVGSGPAEAGRASSGSGAASGTASGKAASPPANAAAAPTATAASAGNGEAAVVPIAFELPFIVRGDWDRPIVLPDPQALIRRSGAARPLFGGPGAMGVVDPLP
ncbi:AsmA family protein [Starkeya koreensis]|uniref:AsmA family protein n=1 Tax=Ancylobacter koreensis TaxID=266121 RepID=A0ABT0DP98_9HYPH|nr:AsmA family protein [Ancylobacter koreensis]MCK0209107.1 AsmA family protein [Ancylobacter koreensis]